MRRLILILIIVLSSLCITPDEDLDVSVQIAKWKGNASGAITLSFDDGYLETYESVIPLLDNGNIRGTFNIITQRVGKHYGGLELADWQQWVEAAKKGHEIASHTATHVHPDEVSPNQLEQELESSNKAIHENTGHEAISFVYPGGAYDSASKDVGGGYYLSARTSDNGYNNASPEEMHLLKSKTAASYAAQEMSGWAVEAEKKGFWMIENYHLVADENPSNYSFYLSTQDFENHLNYLISKELWIAPQGNVAKYVSNTKIVLSLTSSLTSSTFDEPLTVILSLPAQWDLVAVTQEGKAIAPLISKGVIYIDVIPNQGDVVISRV
jgi:peptidoglycan/xylan/chitin deacetylase (PgdA/CDA1 family)